MNRKARKLAIAAALVAGTGLAVFGNGLMSGPHARTRAGSDKVIYLGTIQVTPKDTPERAERNAARYALRTARHGSRSADENRRSS